MSHLPYATPGDDGVLPQDRSHLTTLAVFWFIWTGLCCLGGIVTFLMVILFAGVGLSQVGSGNVGGGQGAAAGVSLLLPVLIFGVLLLVYAVAIFFGFRTAIGLQKLKFRTTIFAMACIMCVGFPLGTILGVFTLIVINRPSVQEAFARNQAW